MLSLRIPERVIPSVGSGHAAWGRVTCVIVAVALLAGAGGCGKKSSKKTKAAGGGEATSEAAPAIDPDTAIVVDEGRVMAASPTGWTRAGRSKDHVVKFQPGPKKTYPIIVVTAEDCPAGFPAITADNQQEFVAALAAGMEATFEQIGKSPLAKRPTAAKLGPHLGAAWAMPAQAKVSGMKETIEQQYYAVIIGDRMYKVAAKAPKGKLDAAAKAAARAVAGALAVPAAETPADAPSDAPPPADGAAQEPSAPAEATPADGEEAGAGEAEAKPAQAEEPAAAAAE